MAAAVDAHAILLRKLCRLGSLEHTDQVALRELPLRLAYFPRGSAIVRHGEEVKECCFLIEGYACRHKMTKPGDRQIVSFHVAGDLLDLQHLWLPVADHNVETIGPAHVAFIPAERLRDLCEQRPAIGTVLWRDSLIDASIFREWVLNVGQRDAKTRVAHMLCEFAAKRQAAGLGGPESFELPMTQEQIGDATGLTAVHVNRTLRALEESGILERDVRQYRIADWQKMQRCADFQSDYLHQAA